MSDEPDPAFVRRFTARLAAMSTIACAASLVVAATVLPALIYTAGATGFFAALCLLIRYSES